MKKLQKFEEGDIPYATFEQFGITKQMLDDLPLNIMNKILSGKETPLMTIIHTNDRNERIKSKARLVLVKTEDGLTDLCIIPQWKVSRLDQDEFNIEMQQQLLKGAVTTKTYPDKGLCYIQFDNVINQVVAVPADIIRNNIQVVANKHGLNKDDITHLAKGNLVSYQTKADEDYITIGINLRENIGVQITNGNADAWHEEKKVQKMPKYNFGQHGCWISDDDGELSYVDEANFTERIKKEQERMKIANAAKFTATSDLQENQSQQIKLQK